MTNSLFPVRFDGDNQHIVFVAFDHAAAADFALTENDEAQCEIMTVDELPLVDRYGFPCERRDAAFIAPWLAEVSNACAAWYAPEAWARYVREMSMGG